MATVEPARDWLFSIGIPTFELRDRLITDVADSVSAATKPPVVAVRMIGVVDNTPQPMLEMHIRTRTAISHADAEAVAMLMLRRHASRLDLSGLTVTVVGPISPDEPSMP